MKLVVGMTIERLIAKKRDGEEHPTPQTPFGMTVVLLPLPVSRALTISSVWLSQ
jgi:hypothetical protein